MKDAFGNDLKVGDKIIYATSGSSHSISHTLGEIAEFYDRGRVSIRVVKTSGYGRRTRNPLVNASNVILISSLEGYFPALATTFPRVNNDD